MYFEHEKMQEELKLQIIMGKAENVKRAKKLKEAKRKREQTESISAGLGPASQVLKERNSDKKTEVRFNDGKVKYSELLKEFVYPILSQYDEIGIVKSKLIFAVHAWNAATAREKSEKIYQSAKKELFSIIPMDPESEQLFDELVKRKEEDFAEFKCLIADFELRKIRGLDYDLSVAVTPLN